MWLNLYGYKAQFFELATLKKKCFASHENQSVSCVARMGRNFDDYSGFQYKTTAAYKYAIQCMSLIG